MTHEDAAEPSQSPMGLEFIEDFGAEPKPHGPFSWRVAAGLFAACVVGSFAMMPFTYSLMLQMSFPGITFDKIPVLMAAGVVGDAIFGIGLSCLAIVLGLWLGGIMGIGVPMLNGWGADADDRARATRSILLGIVSGIVLGVMVIASARLMQGSAIGEGKGIVLPPPREGFLASIGAGIREEVWLRLGLMTFLTWFGTAILRRPSPGNGVIWSANFLATLAFAAMHVPQAIQLIGMSVPLMIFVFVGNGVPGLVFGWLYWKKGLIAAMVSHFFLDIVLKVIAPLSGV